MQRILSSMVLKDYQQYSPEQMDVFRRSSSRNKFKFNEQGFQATAATHRSNYVQKESHQEVQITEFKSNYNELDELGKVITEIQNKLQITKSSAQSSQQNKQLKSELKLQQKKIKQEQKILQQEQEQQLQRKKLEKKQYLKAFKQKMQLKKQMLKKGNTKFELAQFKNKINFRMLKLLIQKS